MLCIFPFRFMIMWTISVLLLFNLTFGVCVCFLNFMTNWTMRVLFLFNLVYKILNEIGVCLSLYLPSVLSIFWLPWLPYLNLLHLQLRAILLDPSCSGSGTAIDRLDHLLPSYNSGKFLLLRNFGAHSCVHVFTSFQFLLFAHLIPLIPMNLMVKHF